MRPRHASHAKPAATHDIVLHGDIPTALAQLAPICIDEQGQVPEIRRPDAERVIQLHMLGRRGQPLFAAQDVRDTHRVVVDDAREVVRREAVALEENEVVVLGRREGVSRGGCVCLGSVGRAEDEVGRVGNHRVLCLCSAPALSPSPVNAPHPRRRTLNRTTFFSLAFFRRATSSSVRQRHRPS